MLIDRLRQIDPQFYVSYGGGIYNYKEPNRTEIAIYIPYARTRVFVWCEEMASFNILRVRTYEEIIEIVKGVYGQVEDYEVCL